MQHSPPDHEYDVYVEEDRVTFVKKSPDSSEDTPHPTRQVSSFLLYIGYLALSWLLLFLPSSTSSAAEPLVTVTIVPKTYPISITQAIQLPARMLAPLTVSQAQTTATTGHGHQKATQARGYITLYNGLFTSQTFAAGTILTARSGIQVITDQSAYLPAANPPGLGTATVVAHAIATGAQGNIPAYAINQTCCATAVKAVNRFSFSGGQDERFFSIVTQHDIDEIAKPLAKALSQSVAAVFTAQLTPSEALIPPLCSESITPDHTPGAAATTVTVTVSEHCTAGAYEKQSLQEQASQLLTTAAHKQVGTGYRLVGDTKLTITHAAIHNGRAILAITSSGLWMYQINSSVQERLLHLIAGKPSQEAVRTLLSMSGIQQVTITGIAANAIVPGDTTHIHLLILSQD